MTVLSINTAEPKELKVGDKSVTTGIFKLPQSGPVSLGELGFEGDNIVHTNVHGGLDQAVYIYSKADYQWWENELGRELTPGMFGENLTISGFHDGDLHIGDRLFIGESVLLEITAPRVPCAQFAAKMGDPKFGKKFVDAVRPGAYARVINAGLVNAGDEIRWEPTTQDYASINDVFIEWHKKAWSEALALKALQSPISSIAREIIEERSGVKA